VRCQHFARPRGMTEVCIATKKPLAGVSCGRPHVLRSDSIRSICKTVNKSATNRMPTTTARQAAQRIPNKFTTIQQSATTLHQVHDYITNQTNGV